MVVGPPGTFPVVGMDSMVGEYSSAFSNCILRRRQSCFPDYLVFRRLMEIKFPIDFLRRGPTRGSGARDADEPQHAFEGAEKACSRKAFGHSVKKS